MNYLAIKEGIIEFSKKRKIRSFFCKHKEIIYGKECSASGLQRINGDDYYMVCKKCGKIIEEYHTEY